MKYSVLASGSKGNCTYIETKNHRILIDIGTSTLQVEKKLKEIHVEPKTINAIFITHAHTDHTSALEGFVKKYKPDIYTTDKMRVEGKFKVEQIINVKGAVELDGLVITPLKLSHDVTDAHGYIFEEGDNSLVYITDTGYIHERYHEQLINKNVYIFESNHDIEMLMNNPNYPHPLKVRILGSKGHLSNVDSSTYLSKFIGSETKHVILAHLSEENNTPELAIKTLIDKLEEMGVAFSNISAAKQDQVMEMLEV